MKKTLTFVLGAVLALGIAAAAATAAETRCAPPGIEGTWLTTVYRESGEPVLQALHNFTRDGRTTMLLPWGGEGVNAGDPRVGCMGEWRPAGPRTFDVTMYCLDRQDPGTPPDVIRFKLRLDRRGARLSGPFTYFFVAWDVVLPFTAESTRLGVQPLE